jgi:hypothetical protein
MSSPSSALCGDDDFVFVRWRYLTHFSDSCVPHKTVGAPSFATNVIAHVSKSDGGRKGWVEIKLRSWPALLLLKTDKDHCPHRCSDDAHVATNQNSISRFVSIRRLVYPPFASAVSIVRIPGFAGRKGWGTHGVVRDKRIGRTFCLPNVW